MLGGGDEAATEGGPRPAMGGQTRVAHELQVDGDLPQGLMDARVLGSHQVAAVALDLEPGVRHVHVADITVLHLEHDKPTIALNTSYVLVYSLRFLEG